MAKSFNILLVLLLSGCATKMSSYEQGCKDGLSYFNIKETVASNVCDDLIRQKRSKLDDKTK